MKNRPINFIKDKNQFLYAKELLNKVFNVGIDFPENVFKKEFISFIALSDDVKIFYEEFFEGILRFLKSIGDEKFILYTLLPSPEDYFFKYFNKYSVAEIALDSSYNDYIDFVNTNPGNSPADEIITNSETFVLYSDNSDWGIIRSIDCEIAIVGFKNHDIEEVFLSAFNNKDLFIPIKSRIMDLDNMLNFSSDTKKFYSKIEKNYLSK